VRASADNTQGTATALIASARTRRSPHASGAAADVRDHRPMMASPDAAPSDALLRDRPGSSLPRATPRSATAPSPARPSAN
jgi:hypothetical protein